MPWPMPCGCLARAYAKVANRWLPSCSGPTRWARPSSPRRWPSPSMAMKVRCCASTCPSTGNAIPWHVWWGRLQVTSVTTKAVSSPRRCGASPTACCCWTKSRRLTPTSTTSYCRCSTTGGSPTARAGWWISPIPSSSPPRTWARTSSSVG